MNTPVIFIPGWPGESITDYTARIANQTFDKSGRWRNIYATDNPSEAKFAICQDNHLSVQLAKNIGFNKSQIIYMKREADSAIANIDPKTVLITYQSNDKIIPAVWWINLKFNDLVNMNYPTKSNKCSTIVSACKNLQGHRDRLDYLEEISKVMKIDVFGRGHQITDFNGQYKGEIKDNGRCKRNGLLSYEYSICIENKQQNGYITEKLNDALLCFCIPIYYGAKNISSYYPSTSLVIIDSLSKINVRAVREQIEYEMSGEAIKSLYDAREKLLYKYNIWNIVSRLVKTVS